MTDDDLPLEVAFEPDELEPRMIPPEDRTTPREPDQPITVSQAVELVTSLLKPIKMQVADIHRMIVGVRRADGTIDGGIGKAVHDVNNSAVVLTDATSVIEDAFIEQAVAPGAKRKTLPELIAESVANKFLAIYQTELRPLVALVEQLHVRIAKLELESKYTGLNGGEPPPDSA